MEDVHKIELEACPYCGGVGALEEENGWCWYVGCLDCGSHTAEFAYRTPDTREEAALSAIRVWNMGKVIRGDNGE